MGCSSWACKEKRRIGELLIGVQYRAICVMKLTIIEARKRLSELVHQVKREGDLRVQITVHGNVAAELRGCTPDPPPGAAAKRLRELMADFPTHRGRKRNTSEQINQHLYGKTQE